jgi:prophage regulatory protein
MAKPTVFHRMRALPSIVGLSRSTIFAMIADGEFPAGQKISARARAWTDEQIAEWQQQRIDAPTSPQT